RTRALGDDLMRSTFFRRTPTAVTCCMLLLASCAAFAQTPGTGAISGVVYDPQNHAVTHAQVLAENESTHVFRSASTTAEGEFHIPLLPPGTYSVTVSATGFAPNALHAV